MLLALTGYELALLSVAAVFIAFALIVALVIPRARPDFPGKALWLFLAICAGLFVAQLTAVFLDASHEEEATAETQPPTTLPETLTTETETTTTETTATETETTTEAAAQGDPVAGKEVFVTTAACGSCHTLADAGTTGSVGPVLDETKPSYDKVVDRVTNGKAVMPSFSDKLTEQQIQDVAAYVSSVAGK